MVVYLVGMPLAYLPDYFVQNKDVWWIHTSEVALANRLAVDLFARVVLTYMVMLM